jgi:hypothetical protein
VVAMFLYCPFVVWVGDVGFDVIALVVVITAMASLMISYNWTMLYCSYVG